MACQEKATKIGILRRTSLVDYPGTVASVIFLKGCNLNCPYCYNKALLEENADETDFVSLEVLYEHLQKRAKVESGLVISGGEALQNQNLLAIINFAKSLNYKIKLDTNGTFPKKLGTLIANPLTKPDYIALDIKTSPNRYQLLTKSSQNNLFELVEESLFTIKAAYTNQNYEVRTVLVPTLVEESDILSIAEVLPKDCAWYLSNFVSGGCLDGNFNHLDAYTHTKVQELVNLAKSKIPSTNFRG